MVLKKKVSKKKTKVVPPTYMVVDGYVYENIGKESDSAPITLEMDDDCIKNIKEYRKNNPGFINDQEAIRFILREQIKNMSE